jgi:2-iminobutanoate/2-iminopropanoate deaminase
VSRRQTYEIPGVTHGSAPIPMAAKVGPNFQSSAIMGKDPATDKLPDSGEEQVRHVFANTKALLDVAGVGLDELVYVDVLLADNDLRGTVNKYWLDWFPDEHDRPARHVTLRDLPSGMVIQLRVQAYSDGSAAGSGSDSGR